MSDEQVYTATRIEAGFYIIPTNDARRLAWVMRYRETNLERTNGTPIADHDAWEYGYIPEKYIVFDRGTVNGLRSNLIEGEDDPIATIISAGPHACGYRTKKAALLDAVKEMG